MHGTSNLDLDHVPKQKTGELPIFERHAAILAICLVSVGETILALEATLILCTIATFLQLCLP